VAKYIYLGMTVRNQNSIPEEIDEKSERKNHLEDLGIDGKIILELILWKQGWKLCTGCMWLTTGTSGRLFVNMLMNLQVP
jgi:hypothetical protein